ncbi:MAG: hypothetical protein ACOYB0_02610 [Polynucleobacter sp.]
MPKLNPTHLPQRIREHIEQMERGEEVEAKKDKTLLDDKWQQALKDALEAQKALKKTHKRPKTEEEKQAIGWKEIREVRIEIYKQALAELEEDIYDIHLKQLAKEQVKATKAYLDGYFGAKEGQDKDSAGRIAVTRAGFSNGGLVASKRDKEVWDMEERLRKQFEAEATDEEKEQLEILRESEKSLKKRRKV